METDLQTIEAIVQAVGAAWFQAYGTLAQVLISGLVDSAQCLLIFVSLRQMKSATDERRRQMGQLDKRIEQQGQALERVGRGIEELLKRSA
jgi:ABC-type Fe3+ transport system permease subunit